ncbi:hypothetical protein B0H17DRAFT_217895 [Mycena rosella]|uniref:DUF6534 domain-containing protein n=1 Tax=Mycena rosella TaxID=1033263 RepID=A0AAD7CXE4_MYCRO|nr:hypothetical protein B0H17DRAFT_217895 [Mycena rosella]
MASFQLDSSLGLGALELGIFATLVLEGILIVQVYIYYICSSDRALVKVLVAVVFVLEVGHTVATAQAIYYWTVTLGRVTEKPGTVYGVCFGMLFETLITFLVQAYFIHRVYRFSQNAWVGACIATLCLLRCACGLVVSAAGFQNLSHEPDYFHTRVRLGWLVTVTFAVGAAVDVFVAASLCVYMHRWKAAPTMKTTSQLINRIMFSSIQTGLITSIVSVAVIICLQAMPDNYVWMGVLAVLGKLYSNSFLASLNIRSLHRNLDSDALRNSFALFSDDSMEGIERRSPRDVELAGASGPSIDFAAGSASDPKPNQNSTLVSDDSGESRGTTSGREMGDDSKSRC